MIRKMMALAAFAVLPIATSDTASAHCGHHHGAVRYHRPPVVTYRSPYRSGLYGSRFVRPPIYRSSRYSSGYRGFGPTFGRGIGPGFYGSRYGGFGSPFGYGYGRGLSIGIGRGSGVFFGF